LLSSFRFFPRPQAGSPDAKVGTRGKKAEFFAGQADIRALYSFSLFHVL
jgi:hypothetical protein